MGLFEKEGSGFKRVTLYMGNSDFESIHVMRGMTKDEVGQVVDKINDRALAQRIKVYMNKHKVDQKNLSNMPKFKSHAQFDTYVRVEVSPNAEWALL